MEGVAVGAVVVVVLVLVGVGLGKCGRVGEEVRGSTVGYLGGQ